MIYYKHYVCSKESNKLAFLIFVICNTISYFCFICLTLNSYSNILHTEQSEEVYKKTHISEKLLIISIYSSLVISLCVIIPFGYFYSEEVIAEKYSGYSEERKHKFIVSIKYTIVFFLAISVAFSVGVILITSNIFKENGVFSIPDFIKNSMYFVLAVFSVIGLCIICLYLAYGLGYLPIQLIISEKSNESMKKECKNNEAVIREKLAYLKEKMKRKGELNASEQLKYETLSAKEK